MKTITWDMVSDQPGPGGPDNEYAFDCYLICAVRVKAPDEVTARRQLHAALDAADSNLGAWPGGAPILAEVSLVTEAVEAAPPVLYEINGNEV